MPGPSPSGEAIRKRILELLESGPRRAGQIATSLGIKSASLSHHLLVLRQAGRVAVTAEGSVRIYAKVPGSRDGGPTKSAARVERILAFLVPGPRIPDDVGKSSPPDLDASSVKEIVAQLDRGIPGWTQKKAAALSRAVHCIPHGQGGIVRIVIVGDGIAFRILPP
ncbi:MAG TPA: ArsR family transcriptional regulator [Planctomycetota bacterium]|nr:ArsR family transcriptional regulator [Planctomycetota bacterium]